MSNLRESIYTITKDAAVFRVPAVLLHGYACYIASELLVLSTDDYEIACATMQVSEAMHAVIQADAKIKSDKLEALLETIGLSDDDQFDLGEAYIAAVFGE